jgi:mono/diheme cytochrome c family protein
MKLPQSLWLRVLAFLLVGALSVGLLPGRATPLAPDDLDEGDRAEQRALAQRAVQENCLICHSEEMIARQRLTPVQWKAEVEKMIGWGAPLPKAQEAPVIDFLTSEYSDRKPLASPKRISYEAALATVREDPPTATPSRGDADRGAALYAANCATCHGPAAQGGDLGPNLVEKPVLFRRADFTGVVRQGRHRMPGFQVALKPDQEDDLRAWLRRQRYGR